MRPDLMRFWADHVQTMHTLLQTDNHSNTSQRYELDTILDAKPTTSEELAVKVINLPQLHLVSHSHFYFII